MNTNPNSVVQTRRDGAILILTLNNPPVNALGHAVRVGLLAAIEQADTDSSVQAVLLVGGGKAFTGGADIREFGQPNKPPSLSDLFNRIEACNKIVVAAIHGFALGGGLEIALSAHYRVALADTKLGLPEVNIGLLPGAGGTQRAPRLIGVRAAAELMLSGQPISAQKAHELGLIDKLAKEAHDPTHAGVAYVQELLTANAPVRRTSDIVIKNKTTAFAELRTLADETAKKTRGLFSPLKIIDCITAAVELPFNEGLAKERALFTACIDSPQRVGLIHAFFAERATAKVPEARAAQPRSIKQLAVIGGGTMGAGITVAALDAGLSVTMIERDAQSIARGQANVEKIYDSLIAKGRLSAENKTAIMARYIPSDSYEDASQADVVIEAAFEDIEVKKTIFRELDRVCKPNTVLASNTSYLDINAIAAATRRPQDVIGLHFFSPANIMRLLEIVVPAKATPEAVSTGFELARRMRKVPVRAGVCDGFIGNRILAAYKQVADFMMEDGASPYEIDDAIRAFGYPIGLFQMADLAGGDIGWATRKRQAATRHPRARYVEIADRLCERGWFGQKTGRGFYLYPQGTRIGQPDPEVLAIVQAERDKKGITPRTFTPEEIMRRYMAAMINEATHVVEEGIALRPLDVDVVFLCGYGFPRWRGGPMKYADTIGLAQILADIRTFAQEDPLFWQPASLLEKLVAEGKNFDSLNT